MNVLVIYGGVSAERSVSLKSGSNVIESLKRAGYNVSEYDPKLDENLNAACKNIDVAFPILHGKGGEDGQIQKQLEDIGIKFVGSDSISSANCFNKIKTMKILDDILFPYTEVVEKDVIKVSKYFEKPFVIKPIDEGSSIDTYIVRDPTNFDMTLIDDVFLRHKKMIIQDVIEGIEITVPVLKDEALPVIEIVPPSGQEFDFANKYNGATQEICPPKNISEPAQTKAKELALRAHRQMGCKSFSRTDFIYSNKKLYCLEINTLPGMTAESLFPKSAKKAGYSIEQLVDLLVQDASS